MTRSEEEIYEEIRRRLKSSSDEAVTAQRRLKIVRTIALVGLGGVALFALVASLGGMR